MATVARISARRSGLMLSETAVDLARSMSCRWWSASVIATLSSSAASAAPGWMALFDPTAADQDGAERDGAWSVDSDIDATAIGQRAW